MTVGSSLMVRAARGNSLIAAPHKNYLKYEITFEV